MGTTKISLCEIENSGCDWITYYDRELNCFQVFEEGEEVADKYIEAPYKGHYRNLTWKHFYEMLSEDELEIANAYTKRRDFFNYMHETGLIYTFYEAEEQARNEYFAMWEKENHLTIDWDNVTTI